MSKPVILCVDDERMILESLKTQLISALGNDYFYEMAENGEDALEVINELIEEETTMIVIVSDWLMPGMKGDEFLIQVHQQFPNIIKILLTGQADESAIQRAQEYANLHGHIEKPWTEAELVATIKSGLAKL